MGKTKIQWCDFSFNPWIGCAKVAPECKNCYAEADQDHRRGRVKWGKGQPRSRTSVDYWKQPLRWNAQAKLELDAGTRKDPPRVFCGSLCDWLDDEVPEEWFADLLDLIRKTPNLDWLLLTKRPQNFNDRLLDIKTRNEELAAFILGWYFHGGKDEQNETIDGAPDNVWFGVSAGADQRAALDVPAKIHFLSCEPMLHAMDEANAFFFDWIIFGGESGKNARPCNVEWIHNGIAFCRRNGIAPFVKQLGANPLNLPFHSLTDSHGGDIEEWPEDLRVREFPSALRSSAPAGAQV